MIGPTTRLFGLVMTDPRVEGHVARLYNYLLGFNGLDAAYLTFVLQPQVLERTLDGFARAGQQEALHVAPAHQLAAGRWAGAGGPVDTLVLKGGLQASLEDADAATWLDADVVRARALRDGQRCFGRVLEAPPDWKDVVLETTFRPCKLTRDDFEEHYRVRRNA
jgi:hypothetical protein